MSKVVARHVAALLVPFALATSAFAAPPPLAPDALPPGVWNLVGVGSGPNPWPDVAVQLGVADDGTTVFGDAGCTRFAATASRPPTGFVLEITTRSTLDCDDERVSADAVVLPVLEAHEHVEVIAGRLHVQGAGQRLVYAPAAPPSEPGVPGAPPVASSDRLDPSRFAPIVDASASNGAAWVRDPLQVALLFASTASTGRTSIVREDEAGGDATVVRLWFDGLHDDAVTGAVVRDPVGAGWRRCLAGGRWPDGDRVRGTRGHPRRRSMRLTGTQRGLGDLRSR